MKLNVAPRNGAVAVETAFVFPIFVLLLAGLIVGGLGVFRYQLVATQAREASRWASVRGSGWSEATGKASPTKQEIINEAVKPLALGMALSNLCVQVEWIDALSDQVCDWDAAAKTPTSQDASGNLISNRVRVTVTYEWLPAGFFAGPYEMQSVSEIPMSF